MTRSRRIEKLLGMLAHAEADTAEGRAARTLSKRFQARHRITAEELAKARAWRDRRAATRVTLDGWTEPWLVDIAFLVAAVSGCRAQVVVDGATKTPAMVIVGQGAGADEERARGVRAVIEASVARAGGEAGVRGLRVRSRGFGQVVTIGGFGSAATTWGGGSTWGSGMLVGQSTLGGTCGDSALTVYRMIVTREVLGPELERFAREAEEEERRVREERRREDAGARSEPARPRPGNAGEAPAGQDTPPPEAPRKEPPPPAPIPVDDELLRARQRAEDLMRRTFALAQRADDVAGSRPAWMGEAVPVVPGALAVRCA